MEPMKRWVGYQPVVLFFLPERSYFTCFAYCVEFASIQIILARQSSVCDNFLKVDGKQVKCCSNYNGDDARICVAKKPRVGSMGLLTALNRSIMVCVRRYPSLSISPHQVLCSFSSFPAVRVCFHSRSAYQS